VAGEVRERGSEPYILELDLLADNAVGQVQEFLAGNGLVCDVLVNSSGHSVQGLAASLPLDAQLGTIDLNIRALTELTLALVPPMVARRGGGVINLASVAALVPGPQMAIYYATKSYVYSFSQALYQELKATGVTITCVAPGPVETEFLQGKGIKLSRLFRALPKLSPDAAAEIAWRGFRKRRRLVVPGISSKLAVVVATLVPRPLILPVINKLQRRIKDKCPCGSGLKYRKCHGRNPKFWPWQARKG
jgi:short-subunit dehydrogenase